MAVRTSVSAVSLIVSTDLDASQIEALLIDASLWVDEVFVPKCPAATTGQLTAIEKYLTAFYVTLQDPRLTQARHDDVSESYQRDPKLSEYLRLAQSFDPCGILKDIFGDSKKIRFRTGEAFNDRLNLPRSSYE